jgi:hypothetical protein
MSSKRPVRSAAMAVSLWLATGAAQTQSAFWQCRARPIEPCVIQHGRLSSQNGIALKIWLIGTMRMVGLENDVDDLPPLVRKYLDMTSPDHSYIYGDFSICPLEPDVPGHLRRVCVTGAERLVVQRVDGSGPAFRLVSTWPADGGQEAGTNVQNDAGVDGKIPAAIHSKYREIRDARQWLNPQVIVIPQGVEVRSSALPGGQTTVRVDELRRVLVGLPVSAWPYGRVVLATDTGLLGSLDDLVPIKRNHDEAARVLKALGIEVNWWPSA